MPQGRLRPGRLIGHSALIDIELAESAEGCGRRQLEVRPILNSGSGLGRRGDFCRRLWFGALKPLGHGIACQPARCEHGCLLDPALARDPLAQPEPFGNGRNIGRGPRGNLPKARDIHGMQRPRKLLVDAPDLGEIIGRRSLICARGRMISLEARCRLTPRLGPSCLCVVLAWVHEPTLTRLTRLVCHTRLTCPSRLARRICIVCAGQCLFVHGSKRLAPLICLLVFPRRLFSQFALIGAIILHSRFSSAPPFYRSPSQSRQ